MGKSILSALTVTFALAGLAGTALADVAPSDPCDGKKVGDACTTDGGDDGTCKSTKAGLTCEADTTTDDGKGSCSFGTGASATGGLVFVAAAALLAAARRRRRVS